MGVTETTFFFIGKKENIIKKGIAGKIHRVHNNEQRVTETTCSLDGNQFS